MIAWKVYRHESFRPALQPRGMVLGLYSGVPDYDYRDELVRIASTGATAVSLQGIYRMENFNSVETVRHPTSSPTELSLRRTFRQAKSLGMRMMFFPTINLRNEAASDKWWRGNIEPADWDAWWKNYTAFNVKLARIADEEGVEWYSLGTEMATTHRFPDQWRQLSAEVRKVFKGKLTYSINFDSHDSFTFGDCLDVIGINTYDPIDKDAVMPSDTAIRDGWWWIVYKARTLQARFNRPVMITEVGYPSVAGAHAGPWDFRSAKHPAPHLQKQLMEGALQVLKNWQEGEAVFYYLYGENLKQGVVPGGMEDRTYAPWGKPVQATLEWYFKEPVHTIPPQQAQDKIQESVQQTIAAALRKERDYEDGALPDWIKAWCKSHPEDWNRAKALIASEPIPAKKIPKGQSS